MNPVRHVSIDKVIKILAVKGDGTPKDPVREVIQYWDFNGKMIKEFDSMEGHKPGEPIYRQIEAVRLP